MRAAVLIARKDLRQRLRDRSALMVVLVIPFALAAILGLTLGNTGAGSVKFKLALYSRDSGAPATALRSVLSELERKGVIQLRSASSLAQAHSLADSGAVAAAFYIPPGFSRAASSGAGAVLTVIGDPNQPIGTLVARSVAQSFASELDGIRIAVATVTHGGGGTQQTPAQLAAAAQALPTPVAIRDQSAKRKELDPKTFYAAGMAVFFLFFTVQFGIASLLDERREGTLARLQAAPIGRPMILVGKALTSLVLGVLGMAALALASSLLLGAHWGNAFGVALLIVAGVLAASAVMGLVVTLARTPDQAGYWQSIVALVLGMLGGTFFPVYQAGGVVEKLSLLTPHAWFLRGLRDLAGGASASAALGPTGVILIFALVCGAGTLARAGRLIEP
jgi:ABC-2 type transport system permease protein